MDNIHVDLAPEEAEQLTTFWQTIQNDPQLKEQVTQKIGQVGNSQGLPEQAFSKITQAYQQYSSSS